MKYIINPAKKMFSNAGLSGFASSSRTICKDTALLADSQLTFASTCNCSKTVTSSLFPPDDANITGGYHFSSEALLPCLEPSPAKKMFSHQASLPDCSRSTCTDISNKIDQCMKVTIWSWKQGNLKECKFYPPHPNIKRRKFSKVWKQIDERQESKFAPCTPKEAILRTLFLSCRHYQEGAG